MLWTTICKPLLDSARGDERVACYDRPDYGIEAAPLSAMLSQSCRIDQDICAVR
jgi:hypothetical protein